MPHSPTLTGRPSQAVLTFVDSTLPYTGCTDLPGSPWHLLIPPGPILTGHWLYRLTRQSWHLLIPPCSTLTVQTYQAVLDICWFSPAPHWLYRLTRQSLTSVDSTLPHTDCTDSPGSPWHQSPQCDPADCWYCPDQIPVTPGNSLFRKNTCQCQSDSGSQLQLWFVTLRKAKGNRSTAKWWHSLFRVLEVNQ